MNERTKEQIINMKELVMRLHRSAGSLDQMIQKIEREINEKSDKDFMKDYLVHFIQANKLYRADIMRYKGFDNFAKDEDKIWNDLIKAIKEGS